MTLRLITTVVSKHVLRLSYWFFFTLSNVARVPLTFAINKEGIIYLAKKKDQTNFTENKKEKY